MLGCPDRPSFETKTCQWLAAWPPANCHTFQEPYSLPWNTGAEKSTLLGPQKCQGGKQPVNTNPHCVWGQPHEQGQVSSGWHDSSLLDGGIWSQSQAWSAKDFAGSKWLWVYSDRVNSMQRLICILLMFPWKISVKLLRHHQKHALRFYPTNLGNNSSWNQL